jgi:sugar lactone lactonase YvrE
MRAHEDALLSVGRWTLRSWGRGLAVSVLCLAGLAQSEPWSSPTITTYAGGGSPASGNGDGGPATSARLINPIDVAVDSAGNVYIADIAIYVGQDGFKVRKVDVDGRISTVAGNGSLEYNGDGIPATSAAISVKGIAVDASGNLFIADGHNQRIRKVAPNGIITTVAGTGVAGFSGDGGQARNARLNFPIDVATDAQGNLYVMDGMNVRVRQIATDGIIRTVAGNGVTGFTGDGGPAIQASFSDPQGIFVDLDGSLYVADRGNDRIRKVSAGIIRTVAGGGHFRTDPVSMNSKLYNPSGVALDHRGNLYIAEQNNLVRVMNKDGIIRPLAGQYNDSSFNADGGLWGFSGDGGPADQALLYEPTNLALDASSNILVADSRNGRVRRISASGVPRTPKGTRAFHPYEYHMVGSFTQHVAVADVTGDGRDDAMLTTSTWGCSLGAEPENDMRLWLFVQRPDGTLAPPVKKLMAEGSCPPFGTGLAASDLNHDGYADAIVGSNDGVLIFPGSSSGFQNAIPSPAQGDAKGVRSVAVTDVDRDGNNDIVTFSAGLVGTTGLQGITIHYGDGTGRVVRKTFFASSIEGQNLQAVDMNRDGFADLVSHWFASPSGEASAGGVDILYHNRVSGYLPPVRLRSTVIENTIGDHAVGDFNGDGLMDVVVSSDLNAPSAWYVLFQQNVRGGFDISREWRAFDIPAAMLGADMNGDGRHDLLVAHGGWSSIGYHQQEGGGLDDEIKYFVRHSGHPLHPSLATGDLNSDGCRDAVASDYNYGLIVLRGRNCSIPANGSLPKLPPSSKRWEGVASHLSGVKGYRRSAEHAKPQRVSAGIAAASAWAGQAWMHGSSRMGFAFSTALLTLCLGLGFLLFSAWPVVLKSIR